MEIKRLKELNEGHIKSYGMPDRRLTDKQWQQDFAILKLSVTPHPKNQKKMSGGFIRECVHKNSDQDIEYLGMTD